MNRFNVWSLSSFLISFIVIVPIITVSVSFFEETSNYYQILKDKTIFFDDKKIAKKILFDKLNSSFLDLKIKSK